MWLTSIFGTPTASITCTRRIIGGSGAGGLFLLAFTHCAAGALRGCGRAVIPMATLLLCWCGIRILYVTNAVKIWPMFQTISWAYPLTWGLSALILLICMLRVDWGKSRI